MSHQDAVANLAVIRTLMERSAVYRRALSPILCVTGGLGVVAAAGGCWLPVGTPARFASYWSAVAALAAGVAFVLARRQARQDAEPFWSAPARQMAVALSAPFVAGALWTMGVVAAHTPADSLVVGWLYLYGCALHAAGYFSVRTLRRLGWLFVLGGFVVQYLAATKPAVFMPLTNHLVMGAFFGVLQLAAAGYLGLTEKGTNAA